MFPHYGTQCSIQHNVFGTVIMTVIARVHPVHLMNVESRHSFYDPTEGRRLSQPEPMHCNINVQPMPNGVCNGDFCSIHSTAHCTVELGPGISVTHHSQACYHNWITKNILSLPTRPIRGLTPLTMTFSSLISHLSSGFMALL